MLLILGRHITCIDGLPPVAKETGHSPQHETQESIYPTTVDDDFKPIFHLFIFAADRVLCFLGNLIPSFSISLGNTRRAKFRPQTICREILSYAIKGPPRSL